MSNEEREEAEYKAAGLPPFKEELGGDIWFVVRPIINNISHHISEETLRWQDFQNVIVNNHSLEYSE